MPLILPLTQPDSTDTALVLARSLVLNVTDAQAAERPIEIKPRVLCPFCWHRHTMFAPCSIDDVGGWPDA